MENRDNNPSPCDICGDIGIEKFIMTCFSCREVREHIYCAKIRLRSPPDMWLCQVCRSPSRVLHIPNLVDSDIMKALATDHLVSPSKKRKPQFLAFPSPKRKPRTPRFPEDIEEANRRQGSQSSYPCVFHRID